MLSGAEVPRDLLQEKHAAIEFLQRRQGTITVSCEEGGWPGHCSNWGVGAGTPQWMQPLRKQRKAGPGSI